MAALTLWLLSPDLKIGLAVWSKDILLVLWSNSTPFGETFLLVGFIVVIEMLKIE